MNSSSLQLQSTRVDLVGSMLRPQELKEAFAKYGEGQLNEADLKTAQNNAIRDLVAKQVTRNLPIVVDGEFRRTSFMESFAVVAGVEEWQAGVKPITRFSRATTMGKTDRTKAPIRSCLIESESPRISNCCVTACSTITVSPNHSPAGPQKRPSSAGVRISNAVTTNSHG